MLMEAFILGTFGLIIGSFLNVIILRRGARSLGGRSGCMSCGTTLEWYDLLPVVSWLMLRGRCRSCRTWISVQYPLVEALTAVLFIGVGLAPVSYLVRVIGLAVAALFIIIAVYDLRHTIIPDEWVWPFNILTFLSGLALFWPIVSGVYEPHYLLGWRLGDVLWWVGWFVASGPLTAFPLFALWAASHGTWMGFGDVKLSLGIGWLLGVFMGIQAVFLAFIIGAVISVCILLPLQYWQHVISGITRLGRSRKRFTIKSEVPFGPFLVMSTVIVWLSTLWNVSLPFLFYY